MIRYKHLTTMKNMSIFLLACVILTSVVSGLQLDNGLALTPPMGWMHWERFRCITDCSSDPQDCLTEDLIKSQVDRMVADGYRDAGYVYVSIDDCWMDKKRASNGSLMPDPVRFPSGIKALADYIHSKGMKLGIYEDVGTETCQGYPGSQDYLELDAKTFASWGVDLLKLDGCNSFVLEMKYRYETMGKYLNATGRPILYLCSWAAYVNKYSFLTDYPAFSKWCNQWRNYNDMQDSWDSLYDIISYYGNNEYHMASYAGPGHWNDPDELLIGNFGLSYEQEKVQMGMWAMMASPLFMSLDMRNVRPEAKLLLQNRTLIAINQDPLGYQAVRLWKVKYGLGTIEGWTKILAKPGTAAIAIINSDNEGAPIMFKTFLDKFIVSPLKTTSKYSITDILYVEGNRHNGVYNTNDTIVFRVNPTGIYLGTIQAV